MKRFQSPDCVRGILAPLRAGVDSHACRRRAPRRGTSLRRPSQERHCSVPERIQQSLRGGPAQRTHGLRGDGLRRTPARLSRATGKPRKSGKYGASGPFCSVPTTRPGFPDGRDPRCSHEAADEPSVAEIVSSTERRGRASYRRAVAQRRPMPRKPPLYLREGGSFGPRAPPWKAVAPSASPMLKAADGGRP